MKTENAKIESTMLGIEHYGCMSFMIHLDYGRSGQGFGGYNYNGDKGAIRGMNDIRKLLEAVGVENWEELKGQLVRIKREDGFNSKIEAIGHILEDKWFSF